VVTAASSDYFERARNLVGSVHVWQVCVSVGVGVAGVCPCILLLLIGVAGVCP